MRGVSSTLGTGISGNTKWFGAVLAPNGKIYCVPFNAQDILIIDKAENVPPLPVGVVLSPHLNKI